MTAAVTQARDTVATPLTPDQVESSTAATLVNEFNNNPTAASLAADYYTGLNTYTQANGHSTPQDFAAGVLADLPDEVSNHAGLYQALTEALGELSQGKPADLFNVPLTFDPNSNLVTPG